MENPYFATYTGCDDVFIVAHRENGEPATCAYSTRTMEDAKHVANTRNLAALIDQLAVTAHNCDLENEQDLKNLHSKAHRLSDLLYWDFDVYGIEWREREARGLAEAAKANDGPEEVTDGYGDTPKAAD